MISYPRFARNDRQSRGGIGKTSYHDVYIKTAYRIQRKGAEGETEGKGAGESLAAAGSPA